MKTEQSPTLLLLQYLKENGATTLKNLDGLPFYGGVKSRIGEIIKQGRIEKVMIHNPDFTGKVRPERMVLTALKFISFDFDSKQGKHPYLKNLSPQEKEEAIQKIAEKIKAKAEKNAINKAIALLERNGYSVTKTK